MKYHLPNKFNGFTRHICFIICGSIARRGEICFQYKWWLYTFRINGMECVDSLKLYGTLVSPSGPQLWLTSQTLCNYAYTCNEWYWQKTDWLQLGLNATELYCIVYCFGFRIWQFNIRIRIKRFDISIESILDFPPKWFSIRQC